MIHEKSKSKSLNQMTEAERDLYWKNYKKLVADTPETLLEYQELIKGVKLVSQDGDENKIA